jgi:hypothetical protein
MEAFGRLWFMNSRLFLLKFKDKFYVLIYQIISGIRDEIISGDNKLLKARLSLREASICSIGVGSNVSLHG